MTVQFPWTSTQINALAQDKYGVRACRTLATAEKWQSLAQQQSHIWGLFPARNKKPPFQTTVNLSGPYFSCTCPDKKYPCSHTLALLLLYMDRPDLFQKRATPGWVSASAIAKPASVANDNHHFDLDYLQAGLQELAQWLHDMVDNGLAAVQSQPKRYWLDMADRLVDVHALNLADEVRALATIPGQADDWPEQLLARLGRLHLLIEGFQQFERLPPETQADLQVAVGWENPSIKTEADDQLQDRWQIIGWRLQPRRTQKVRRYWLWGEQSNRLAYVEQAQEAASVDIPPLIPGTGLAATLTFYPSATPYRAKITAAEAAAYQPQQPPHGTLSIQAAYQQYTTALAQNPWLTIFPLFLQTVDIYQLKEHWWLVDQAGFSLPLPAKFEQGWQLKALTASTGLHLFGEWDGDQFCPLSLWQQGQWHSAHTLKEIR